MKLQDIDFDGKKLKFSLEPYFGSYDQVRKQIQEEGLRPATFREVVALLFANEGNYEGERSNIVRAFKSHPVFGYTALEQRYQDKKYSLVEQDNPKISRGRIASRGDEKIIEGEDQDLRSKYYASLGKSKWTKLVSNSSFLYNNNAGAVIPIVTYKREVEQLSSEERRPYSDDWGRDKVDVTPARYREDEYNLFKEARLENGELYLENLPIRGVSFGIKKVKGGEK